MYCFLSGSYQKTYFETKPSCLGMQHSFAMAALRIDIGFGGPYYCFTVCQHTPQASVLFGMCLLLSCDIVMLSCSASPMLTCKQSNSFAMLALLMIFEKFLRAALGILGQGIRNILATPAPLLTRINNGDRDMALMARYIKGALASSRILFFWAVDSDGIRRTVTAYRRARHPGNQIQIHRLLKDFGRKSRLYVRLD